MQRFNGRLDRLEAASGGGFHECPRCGYPEPPPPLTDWQRLEQVVATLAKAALAEGRALVIDGAEVLPTCRPRKGSAGGLLHDRVAGTWIWPPVLRRLLEAVEGERADDDELDRVERLRQYLRKDT